MAPASSIERNKKIRPATVASIPATMKIATPVQNPPSMGGRCCPMTNHNPPESTAVSTMDKRTALPRPPFSRAFLVAATEPNA